jgi:hypothetical protein
MVVIYSTVHGGIVVRNAADDLIAHFVSGNFNVWLVPGTVQP